MGWGVAGVGWGVASGVGGWGGAVGLGWGRGVGFRGSGVWLWKGLKFLESALLSG